MSGLFSICRNYVFVNSKSTKNVLQLALRNRSNAAALLKSQRKQNDVSYEVFKYILLAMPVTTFGLGCWQTYRLRWKLDLIDRMTVKANATPEPIPHDLEELKKMEYMPVKVKGVFLHDKEFLIGPRALIEQEGSGARFGSLMSDPKKNQGFLVITPFQLSDTGEIILVNRGWIHQSDKPKERRTSSFVKNDVELVGVVRLTEGRSPFIPKNNPEKGAWYYRDLDQMSKYIGCAPVWLDARGIAEPPEGWPLPNQTRVTLRNEHMSYLVTWFSLSGATAYMWHRYFIKKLPLL